MKRRRRTSRRRIKKRVKRKVKRQVKKRVLKKRVRPKKKQVKKIIVRPKKMEKMPDEKAYSLLKSYKIPIVKQTFCKKEKDILKSIKKIGLPCVMKISGDVIHKAEIGGVVTINSEEEAPRVFKKMMRPKRIKSVLIQEKLSGIEIIIGIKRDKSFGPVITIGLGGSYVEILKDVSFRICPITSSNAEEMIKELKGYKILEGIGDKKPINLNKLNNILTKVCRLAIKNKIKEMDINPLFCNEKDCLATDVRIVK